ncbi:MAG: hypothetical protein JSW33_07180 [bacterium]|nr:MAG: hypothetical protein JSW33_07180 [bacterium]
MTLYIFPLIFVGFTFCQSENQTPDLVQIGMHRQQVQNLLGKPARVDSLEKRTEIIWGAEEAFWDELPMETKLEVWIYEVGENELRVYFLEADDSLFYKIVEPKDAVYESVD